jgi:hypothetical protein
VSLHERRRHTSFAPKHLCTVLRLGVAAEGAEYICQEELFTSVVVPLETRPKRVLMYSLRRKWYGTHGGCDTQYICLEPLSDDSFKGQRL